MTNQDEKLNEEILLIMFAGMSMNRGARNTIKKALDKARQQGRKDVLDALGKKVELFLTDSEAIDHMRDFIEEHLKNSEAMEK